MSFYTYYADCKKKSTLLLGFYLKISFEYILYHLRNCINFVLSYTTFLVEKTKPYLRFLKVFVMTARYARGYVL